MLLNSDGPIYKNSLLGDMPFKNQKYSAPKNRLGTIDTAFEDSDNRTQQNSALPKTPDNPFLLSFDAANAASFRNGMRNSKDWAQSCTNFEQTSKSRELSVSSGKQFLPNKNDLSGSKEK